MALILPEIEIHEPENLKEACALLKKLGRNARILAGGTDLIVDLKEKRAKVSHLVSLAEIVDIDRIKKDGKALSIGAGATANRIAANSMVARFLPALVDACNSMASYHIRNLATIGGNLVSAVPSADLPPILIVADAKVELQGPRGKRKVKLENFFKGPRRTDMKPGEVLTRIIIPAQPKKSGSSYHKFALRNATALAVAGVAARVEMEKGLIKKAAIALGAVAPTPKLAKRAAAALRRKKPSKELFEEAAAIAVRESKPISDIRGSAEYRRDIVEVLTRRALEDAVARARGKKRK